MDEATQRWVWVTTHVGKYEVSDFGGLRGVDRILPHRKYGPNGTRRYCSKPKEPWTHSSGHLYVDLYNPRRRVAVHRLVLEAFVGPASEGQECCHNNGDPRDNRLENLRWDSRPANIDDMVKHGSHWQVKKTHCQRGHPLVEPNLTRCKAKNGQRNCLACNRAQAKARYHGASLDFDAQADYEFTLIMQGKSVGAVRTLCSRGHALTPENCIVRSDRKNVECRICAREGERRRKAARKAA